MLNVGRVSNHALDVIWTKNTLLKPQARLLIRTSSAEFLAAMMKEPGNEKLKDQTQIHIVSFPAS